MRRIFTIIFLSIFLLSGISVFSANILFDYTKDERAGNADWVIDTNYPVPSPSNPSSESAWAGAISSWGYGMYLEGHTCHTLTSSYGITYGDGSNPYDLSNYDIFVVCEPQKQFTSAEKTAILNFVNNGGGLFIVSDHYGSDRDNSGWDSVEIWNDFGTETYFGFHFQTNGETNNNITYTSSRVSSNSSDPIIHGSHGDVSSFAFHNGSTITLNTGNNSTATGHIWYDASHNYVMYATAEYGSGKVCAVTDSSPADDGTGASGDNLYDGWNEASDKEAFLNGMEWLLTSSCNSGDTTAPDWAASGIANLTVNPGNGVNALDWDDASDSENPNITYSVYRDTVSGFTPGSSNKITSGLTDSLYTDSGLANGTTYYYRVSVENCVPLSRYNSSSDEASGTPSSGGGGSALDISGYQIIQYNSAATFTFPAGTTINPGQYIVIARSADQATFEADYGALPGGTIYFNGYDVVGGNGFPVINGDEYYDLTDGTNTIETTYDNFGNDPFTVKRNNPGDDASLQASWTSDHSPTPGAGAGTSSSAGLVINEYTDEHSYQTAFIELYYDAPTGSGCSSSDTTAPVYTGGNSGISVADQENGGTLQISWNTANDPENPDSVEYALYRDTVSGFTPSSGNLINTGTATSYTDTGLTNGTTYYYIVQTYNCVPIQSTNTDQGVGVPTDPALPPTLQGATPGDGEVSLTWSSVTGSDEYRLYYSTLDGGPYTLITSTTVTSYTHTGLTNDTTYYYVVKNYDTQKLPTLSNYSNQLSAVPTAGGSGGTGCANDLIISEYIEGSGSEKYIELYNGTGSSKDLSDYKLQLYANGASTPTNDVTLSGNLADGQTIVYMNSSATLYSGIANSACNFNGDDAVALYKISTSAYVDVIGQIGTDPGNYWGTSPVTTKDHTLVRKSSITQGDTNGSDAFDPATEWDSYAQDTVSYLGSHTMDCAGGPTCDSGDTTPPDWSTSGVSNITVTNSTSSSVDLSWSVATDSENNTEAIKYDLYRSQTTPVDTTTATLITSDTTNTNYTDNSVTSGQTYYYKVVAKNCVPLVRTASDEVGLTVPSTSLKPWTIMVYMNADNNLEGAGIEDFLEMSAVGSDTNINIVVQMDRISGNDSSYDDWTDTKRFYVTNGMTPTIANAVQDLGEVDMGDGNSLVDFAKWVKDNYPAQHYALIIWDHGDGWRSSSAVNGGIFKGASQDDTDGGDYIYFTSGTPGVLGEMGTAWQNIKNYYGQKLDIMGFDVCLDQMWENNAEAEPYFNYFVASEMSEWGDGWAYTTFLNQLATNNGTLTALQLANAIVDAYAAGENGSNGWTQSAIDLSKVDTLTNTINDFAISLRQNLTTYGTEIQTARDNCFELETSDPYWHQIDLYDYCLKLEAQSVPQALKDKSVAVRNAISASVTDNFADTGNNCYGVGIYYPRAASDYDSNYDSTLIAPTNNWDEFIQRLALSSCNTGDTTPPDWASSGISNIAVTNSSTTSVDLSWSVATDSENNTNAITYDLYRSQTTPVDTTTATLISSDGTATTYTDNSVTQGQTYYYKIVSKNCVPLVRTATDEVGVTVPAPPALTIYDVQYATAVGTECYDSPELGNAVTLSGIVSAVGTGRYTIEEASGGWHGILVYDSTNTPTVGDSITLTGTVDEYYGLTELKTLTSFTTNSTGNAVHSATTETVDNVGGNLPGVTCSATDEPYEGVLVTFYNVEVSSSTGANGYWRIKDQGGTLELDCDDTFYSANMTSGTQLAQVTGILLYSYDRYRLNPRSAADIVETACAMTDTTAPDWTVSGTSNITITNSTSTSMDLSWDSATDTENTNVTYDLYRDTATPVNTTTATLVVSDLSGTTYSNTGLTEGTTYYYRVVAKNCVPLSRLSSDEASGTTPSSGSGGTGCANDLIISEYIEGSSNNKSVEIYNGTGSSVDLSNYAIWTISNGGSWPETTISLSGTLADGDVYVVSNPSATQSILDVTDLTSGSASWNGDDAVGLAHNGTLIDSVGTDGSDPGSGWTVAGISTATKDHTLVRKSSITSPTTDWTASAGTNSTDSQWEVYAQDTFSYLGSHTMDCGSGSTCDLTDTTAPVFSGGTSGILATDATTGGTINLSWNTATDTENNTSVKYVLYRSTQTGFTTDSSTMINTGMTSTSYVDNGLTNGITYYYIVQAYNCAGLQTNNTDEDSAVPTNPAQAPTLQNATPGDGEVSLTWSSVSGSDEYRVYYSTQTGGSYTLITSTTVTSYTHTGLTNGTTYYYVVKNYDTAKYPSLSDYSNELSATPQVSTGTEMDISGWKLLQYNSSQTYTFPANTNIPAGGYVIVARNIDKASFETFWGVTLGANVIYINSGGAMPQINGGENYELQNDSSITIDGPTGWILSSGQTAQRTNPGDDGTLSTSWNTGATTIATPGSGAGTSSNAGVVINEYSDASSYEYEFVELYNDSTGAADTEPPVFAGLQSVVDNQLGGQLVLSWNTATDTSTPITYYIYQSTQSGGENFASPDYTTTNLTYTVQYLQNNTTYYYVVRAIDAKGNIETNSVEKYGIPTSKFNDPAIGDLLINEFAAKGTEQVEIYNTSSADTFNLCNVVFRNSTNYDNVYTVSGHSYILPNEYLVFNPNYVTLSNSGDTLTLTVNSTTLDEVEYGIRGGAPVAYSGYSTARVGNTGNMANDWNRDATPTFGSANDAPGVSLGSSVVINEYKVNAANDTYVLELYNPTGSDIDVTGWLFTDGDNSPSGIGLLSGTVPAGGYLVFTKDATTPQAYVNISGDNVYLYDNNGVRVDQASDYGHTFSSSNSAQRVPNGTGGTNNGYNWTTSGFTEQAPTWNGNNDGCDPGDVTPPDWTVSGQSNIGVSYITDHVHITWDVATDSENPTYIYYNIYRSTQAGFTPDASTIIVTGTTSLSYDDYNATKGDTNYYSIATYNCNNNTKFASDEDNTYVPNPPDAPVLSVCAGGNAYVYLEWSSVTGADSYNVYRSTQSGGPYTNISNETVPNYTDNSVTNGTTYYYIVTTVDAEKDPTESTYSNEKWAIPENCLPTGNTVMISEINIYPRDGITNEDGEWIELYNPTASPISIVGWSLSDLGSDTVTIKATCPDVPAYGYLVLGATDNLTLNDNVNVDYVYCRGTGGPGCFALGNNGDEVILKDNTGNTVDMLVYDSTWFDQGYSITKVDMMACSNQKSSWGNETTQWNPPTSGYGTPGTSNFPFGLYQASASLLSKIDFNFTHEVDAASANDVSKYSVYPSSDPGSPITLNSITIDANNTDAYFDNVSLSPGVEYTLEITGAIQDIYYHPVTDSNKKVTFVAPIQLNNGTDPILFPEWSYDGQKIAYIVYNKTSGLSNIWIQNRDGSGKTQLTQNSDNVSHVGQFSFSPNDQYIIYTANGGGYTQLRKIPTSGGSSTLMEPPSSSNWGRWLDPSWGSSSNQADGIERVVCSISGELWVFNPASIVNDSSSLIKLTTLTTGNYHDTYAVSDKLLQPKWSPDNTMITFVRRFAGSGVVESDIYVYNNVQSHISNDLDITSWSNADLERISSYTKPTWSPSISVDGTQVSYVVDVNNLFNNVLFWSDPDGQFASANFDAYYEKSDGSESGNILEDNSYNEGFMKWAPAGGDQYTYTSRDTNGNYFLSVINHPMTMGFNKLGLLSTHDYSYSYIDIYSSENSFDSVTIETPINIPSVKHENYKYIGECRYFTLNGSDSTEIDGTVSIHFMNAEVRNTNVSNLTLMHYDELNGKWVKLNSNVTLDSIGGNVTANVKSLGYFAIASYNKANDSGDVAIVYPNPYTPLKDTSHTEINIESDFQIDNIAIFTVSGEKLDITYNDLVIFTPTTSHEYGYKLQDSKVADLTSGIYLIVVKGETETKVLKLVIVK